MGKIKFGCKLFCSYCCLIMQSQVYRNQADPVSTAYDTTVSTLAAEYSYGPYPHQTDTSQNYYYPSEYNADNTWNAPEQRKLSFDTCVMLSIYLHNVPMPPRVPLQLLLVLQPQKSSPCPTAVPASDQVVILFKFCPICLQMDSRLLWIFTAWRYI